MVAPHFHTTAEAKAAIKKIEHNGNQGGEGKPTGIAGGSSSNQVSTTPSVTSKSKGEDWVHNRGIKGSSSK